MITPFSPANGSTTQLTGPVNSQVDALLTFGVSGGTAGGTTSMECEVTAGSPGAITQNPLQTIGTGGIPLAVRLSTNPQPTPFDLTVTCTALRENSTSQTFTFYFHVSSPELFKDGFED